MFLNIKTFTALIVATFSISAQAQKISTLEAGKYELLSGEKHLCRAFIIGENELSAKRVFMGNSYSYATQNSVHSIESDIDPACEFKEQNSIEEHRDETVLVRINEEFCKGRLRSKTVSTATLRLGEIEITHNIDGVSYTCVWKKDK